MTKRFAFQALDASGKAVNGTLVADSRAGAIAQVAERALHPVSVAESDAGETASRLAGGRISQASIDGFTRGLANLLSAGVPLNRSLQLLGQEASQPAARHRWAAIREDVVGGMSLADALARWPKTFPGVYVAMVRAGEAGGFVDKVLGQIADFRQRERDLTGRVKAALVYPIVLATLAILVMIFLLMYFIPRFSAVFAEFGGALPWLTRAIVATSKIVVAHGPLMLIVAALIVLIIRRTYGSESGRRLFERLLLKTPALGTVIARFALVRFCRMLGTLLAAGVPLIAALKASKEAIGNQTLTDAALLAVEEVQRGAPLGRSLAACPALFPPSVVEMVSVGEESGRLDQELVRLGETYESELDRRLRMLVALAEPLMLFVMAALIGTVVIGMLLPVFTLQELVR